MIKLRKLKQYDWEQVLKNNQEVFKYYGTMEGFWVREDHFEENDLIIPQEIIE